MFKNDRVCRIQGLTVPGLRVKFIAGKTHWLVDHESTSGSEIDNRPYS